MLNRRENISYTLESPGAITLLNGLARRLGIEEHNKLKECIDFWQSAISGVYKLDKHSSPNDIAASETVNRWYMCELQTHSYHGPTWKVQAENALLFQEFRNDPYYYLKNLVEVLMRQVIEEMFRLQKIDATVYLTSDGDDVFGGVDVIVEAKMPDGTGYEYVGVDIAVSDNQEYLEEKRQRTATVCYEFNDYKRLGKMSMVRQVLSVPPHVMTRFLSTYMERVVSQWRVKPQEVLVLFEEAKTHTTETVQSSTRSRVWGALH